MRRAREQGMTLIEVTVALGVSMLVMLGAYSAMHRFGAHQDQENRRMAAMDTSKLMTARVKRTFVDRKVVYSGVGLNQTASPGYVIGGSCRGTPAACPTMAVDFTSSADLKTKVTLTVTTACRAKPAAAVYGPADFSVVGSQCIVCGKGQAPFVTLSYSDGRPPEIYPQGKANGGAKIAAASALCFEPLPGASQLKMIASSGYLATDGTVKTSNDEVVLSTNLERNIQLVK